MKSVTTTAIFAGIALAACVTTEQQAEMIQSRAKFDLSCENIKVVQLAGGAYGVSGCGKRATYVSQCAHGEWGEAVACSPVLNSQITKAPETKSPAAAVPQKKI